MASQTEARRMFDEQIGWAVEAGVDFVIGETYSHFQEALAGLEAIKAAKLPAVITYQRHDARGYGPCRSDEATGTGRRRRRRP